MEEYYSTAMHELAHSTGHETRLNRLHGVAAFGDEVYSTEELTAEICAASVLATLGIDTAGTLRNSAAYVQSWLKALRNDKKMIVVAAARAEKALQMLLDVLKPTSGDDEPAEPATTEPATAPAAPVTQQAGAPVQELKALAINHPNGVMFFADLRSFFPMSAKDFKIVLPLLRHITPETLRNFAFTLKQYRCEAEIVGASDTIKKRIDANIAALAKMYPAAC
jgi:hypothetical protein